MLGSVLDSLTGRVFGHMQSFERNPKLQYGERHLQRLKGSAGDNDEPRDPASTRDQGETLIRGKDITLF